MLGDRAERAMMSTVSLPVPGGRVLGDGTAWYAMLACCKDSRTHRAQYPLNKEYTLNYRGLNIMIRSIFLN